MRSASDDDVVEQAYVEESSSLAQTLRNHIVVATRLSRARRVIMNNNDLWRKQFQCTLNNQAMIYNRARNTALTDSSAVDDAIRGGQKDSPSLLVL